MLRLKSINLEKENNMGFKMRKPNPKGLESPLKNAPWDTHPHTTIGTHPPGGNTGTTGTAGGTGTLTCPECGMVIEDTDGSGSAMQTHMQTAHQSTGGTGAGGGTGVKNIGGLHNQGGYNKDPRGFDSGAGTWDPSHTGYTGGTNFPGGTTVSPRIAKPNLRRR